MGIVQKRRGIAKKKKDESTEDDYGFSYPLETVEELYWERVNSDYIVYPEEGGALDQDAILMNDLSTYGWLVREAEKVLDKDKEAMDLIKKKLGH